jgi:hypothetical protein
MGHETLDGYVLGSMFKTGMTAVSRHRQRINQLNVFPVADGDTGTNLVYTIKAMVDNAKRTPSFADALQSFSEAGMAQAMGNSGIIFASYVSGLAESGRGRDTSSLAEFAQIAHHAVSYAYDALDQPVEGTMISVIKAWAEFLLLEHRRFSSFEALLGEAVGEAHLALRQTTFQLPVLKRYNVVDAGAEGFVRFLEGMNSGFSSDSQSFSSAEADRETEGETVQIIEAGREVEAINFRFCTEATLVSAAGLDKETLLKRLRQFGDSLLALPVRDGFKIHLHTDKPAAVFEMLAQLGHPTQGKIDDMFLQEAVRRDRKRTVAIVCDSIADLPEEYKLEQQIHTLPLSLTLGEIAYVDKRSIDPRRVFTYIDTHTDFPATSLPEPGRIRLLLEELAAQYDSILVITVSGKLSGTYQIVRKEAERLIPNGKPVAVVDSLLNSGAQGLLVQKAAELLDKGKSLEETVSSLLKMRERTRIYVALNSIANAVKGGRVPKTLGRVAMALGARPVMSLDGEGRGVTFGIGFSQQAMIRKILKIVDRKAKQPGIEAYCIVHGDNAEAAGQCAAEIARLVGFAPAYVTEVSSVTAIHAGKGCVAVSFVENEP